LAISNLTYSKHHKMNKRQFLGINIDNLSKNDILEKIIKYIEQPNDIFHIVSLNPEILVIANKNKQFKKVIDTAQIRIIDGAGVAVAARLLNIEVGDRVTGVDLMKELIEMASRMRLRVLLIGGREQLAAKLAKCYQEKYLQASFLGITGIKDIVTPTKDEEDKIIPIVTGYKPHIVLVAFGSPHQELWIDRHSNIFKGAVCMGVGQGFDVASGNTKRAPLLLRKIGMEWFYRLIIQPWRWRRQLRLIEFIRLVIKELMLMVFH